MTVTHSGVDDGAVIHEVSHPTKRLALIESDSGQYRKIVKLRVGHRLVKTWPDRRAKAWPYRIAVRCYGDGCAANAKARGRSKARAVHRLRNALRHAASQHQAVSS
jgi:hypothetical protein